MTSNYLQEFHNIKKHICKFNKAGESALKCLSQGHNRMARVGFKPRPY